jgi:virginiamycin B lyase
MSRTHRTVARLLLSLASFVAPACADDQQAALEPPESEASDEIADLGRSDPAHPSACGQVDEFARPEGVAALDIVTGSDGNLWFASSDALGRVSPKNGSVTLVPIPSSPLQGRLATGPDGNIWYLTGTGVASFSPHRHTVRDIPIPDLAYGQDLVAGPDGAIWVLALQNVARVTVHGHATLFPIPVESLNGNHIAPGPDGNVWFTGGGIEGLQAINRITRNGVITRFPVESPGSVYGLAAGFDRALWFTQQGGGPNQNSIGRMTTGGVASTVVQLPDSTSDPYSAPSDMPLEIAAGPGDSMVFTTYLVEPLNYIGQVNRHGTLTRFEIPTPGAASFGITTGPDGNAWFTENFNPLIGRVDLAACHHHRGPGGPR